MFFNSNRYVIFFFILAIFMIKFKSTLSINSNEIDNWQRSNSDSGQLSVKLRTVIELFKRFWDWKIEGDNYSNSVDESRTFGFRRRMIINTMVPFAFFLGKMTMVILAIKLIGLINLKIGMMLLVINFGILLAKLLILKKTHGLHGEGGHSHYYFSFSSPPVAQKPYYVKHHSHPKNDFFNNLWEDIHRNDQNGLDSRVYSTQIPAPYYPVEEIKYSQPIAPYPYQSFPQRQLLSINERYPGRQERNVQLTKQNSNIVEYPSTTTSHELSTILDEAMSKLKN